MQLLLFLSALLAGLTGAFAGDRAVRVGGQLGEAAITRSAEVAAEAAVAASQILRTFPAVTRVSATFRPSALDAAPSKLPARLITGRWLE